MVFVATACLLSTAGGLLFSQSQTAAVLAGLVIDPTEAVVPSAKLT